MNDIICMIEALKEDMPHLIVTDDIIEQYILDNIDKLIEEIKEEI